MTVHLNSLVAYYAEMEKFETRQKLIYGHVALSRVPLTDREIKNDLFGLTADKNTVSPRVTKLVEKGWLREVGKVVCPTTNKKVRRTVAVTPEERMEAEETGQRELAI